MKNHYSVLGISPDASAGEVRAAYRRQVKAVHPDLHNGTPDSVERMKRLVRAWEVLSDPLTRQHYDLRFGFNRNPAGGVEFNYREFLRNRRDDHESQSKLVFYDLLHDNPDEALHLYASLRATGDFDLLRYLGQEDFMDCAFLLAEEYESRGEYLQAFELYAAIVRSERRRPYFRHFMADVYEHARSIVCVRMPETERSETVLTCINRMIDWGLTRRETAYFHRKAAEIHLGRGDRPSARRSLQRALDLDERLPGVTKLRQELGYFETV